MEVLGFLTLSGNKSTSEMAPPIQQDYDMDADVLYLSVGNPKSALSLDIGDGLLIRYDPDTEQVIGITVIGLRQRLAGALAEGL